MTTVNDGDEEHGHCCFNPVLRGKGEENDWRDAQTAADGGPQIPSARVRPPAPEGYAPACIEFRDGLYERRYAFSDQMGSARINATLKDGVSPLTRPKSSDAGAKKISVKAA